MAPPVVPLENWEVMTAWLEAQSLRPADLALFLGVSRSQVHVWQHGRVFRNGRVHRARPHPVLRFRLEQISEGAVRAIDWSTPAEIVRYRRILRAVGAIKKQHFMALKRKVGQVRDPAWRNREIYLAFCALGKHAPDAILVHYRRTKNLLAQERTDAGKAIRRKGRCRTILPPAEPAAAPSKPRLTLVRQAGRTPR